MSGMNATVPAPAPAPTAPVIVHGITPPVPRVAGPGDDPNDRTLCRIIGCHQFFGFTEDEAEKDMDNS